MSAAAATAAAAAAAAAAATEHAAVVAATVEGTREPHLIQEELDDLERYLGGLPVALRSGIAFLPYERRKVTLQSELLECLYARGVDAAKKCFTVIEESNKRQTEAVKKLQRLAVESRRLPTDFRRTVEKELEQYMTGMLEMSAMSAIMFDWDKFYRSAMASLLAKKPKD